jgi:hypothetical protein
MKKLLLSALILFTTGIAIAQKQPNYPSPQNIKVDGIANEWGSHYQNYNRKNELRYTITNDDKNLYLIIYTTDFLAMDKIGKGGITFTVSKLTDKKLRQKPAYQASLQYPVLDYNKNRFDLGYLIHQYKELKENTLPNKPTIDSLLTSANPRFTEAYKLIKVTGITAVADTFISIYNTQGIKAAVRFNEPFAYVYELAIPLKHLELNAITAGKISYNIKLNGPPTAEELIRAGSFPMPVIRADNPNSRQADEIRFVTNPTDFWGEYTLVKK